MTYLVPYVGAPTKPKKRDDVVANIPVNIPPCPESLKRILFDVCKSHLVHPNDVVGKGRTDNLIAARQAFIWRARNETNASFPRIAKILNRDHSTAVYHYHYVKSSLESKEGNTKRKPKFPPEPKLVEQSKLTPRQRAVQELVAQGYTNYQISVELGISATVVKQAKSMIKKLAGKI